MGIWRHATRIISNRSGEPNGIEQDGYSKTVPTMLTSMNVLESSELKKLKIYRKYYVSNGLFNIIYHCDTHKCSSHYLIITNLKVLHMNMNLNVI